MIGVWLAACSWWSAPDAPPAVAPPVHTKLITSQPYRIQGLYASMRGPFGFDHVTLEQADEPELLWIVGYKTTVVGAETDDALSQEFMCHANLDFEASAYYERWPGAPPLSGRVFTLSQGQQDIRFPEGFGIPITSDLSLSLATQVLNLTIPEADFSVRHRVEIQYVRDRDVVGEMVPLYQGAVEGFKALGEARFYGFDDAEHDDAMGPGCSVGQAAIAGDTDDDRFGQDRKSVV